MYHVHYTPLFIFISSGGDVLVNPDIDQSHKLKSWWKESGSSASLSSLTVQVIKETLCSAQNAA